MSNRFSQLDLLNIIYQTEYYIITEDYEYILQNEYGINNYDDYKQSLQALRLFLKAFKIQYNLDYTADTIQSLYVKIKECSGIQLETVPNVNTNLIVYSASTINPPLIGTTILATYTELLGNLPINYDKVVSVKVFNDYFSYLAFSTKIYKAIITISNGLVINHQLSTEFISVQFYDNNGPIMTNYTIVDNNNIILSSLITITNVHIVILG